ncbi:ABC transporter permease [Clostridium grantii]|uniref:Putative aldouronate transport system permease protein n=1 Tax=Clostridium grantii DSM 8605 TaxID=1121316 RepID=A0A1M5XRU9_9CLOT|nr:ABC transporter permease subunit [Clostridium grantii]SHI02541.1 putative aldouronate transport system permease protein [Clostridium grantii DSM 8605]
MVKSYFSRLAIDLRKNRSLYLIMLPVLIYYILFRYLPMYGATIAFKDFSPAKGIMGSDWVGFKHFIRFFSSHYFLRVLKNTFTLSFMQILYGFPVPIIFAILVNELRNKTYKRAVQTATYLPHFISMVVICGIITQFSSTNGIFNDFLALFGAKPESLLQKPELFRGIYILSEIWQKAGWESIIYLAALTGIDSSLYEAAGIDGANRFKKIMHITLPGLLPTIVIMLILRIGQVMEIGFEKIILLYNPATYEVADVISSYVYRVGLTDLNWSYSAAVGIFNSVVNLTFLIAANKLSKKYAGSGLW